MSARLVTDVVLPPLDIAWEAARLIILNSQAEEVVSQTFAPPIRGFLPSDELTITIRFLGADDE